MEEKASAFAAALSVRNAVSRAVGGRFEKFEALLAPTLPYTPPIGTYDNDAESVSGLEWTQRVLRHSPFNVAGVPAMSVSLETHPKTTFPIGMQFAAGFAREDKLLRLAAQLERSRPWVAISGEHRLVLDAWAFPHCRVPSEKGFALRRHG
jgi:amidase